MVQYEVFTNKGTREINEDRYGVAMYGDSYCFTVADGLGGHGNGEVAAQAAVDVICTTFVDEGYSDSFFPEGFFRCPGCDPTGAGTATGSFPDENNRSCTGCSQRKGDMGSCRGFEVVQF